MTKAETESLRRLYQGSALDHQTVALQVVRRDWLTNDQPELHLTISDRSTVRVQWSIEYGCRYLAVAATPDADFVDCTPAETGLHPDVVEEAVSEVYEAVRRDECERLADDFDDGRGDEAVPR